MAIRDFAYNNPNYQVVRQHCCGVEDVASATAFAKFRSRCKVVVNAITAVVVSASSLAKIVFTIERAASTNGTFTIVSATSAGAYTTYSCAITLASAGDLLNLKHNDTGDYQILYEYNVVPTEQMYASY